MTSAPSASLVGSPSPILSRKSTRRLNQDMAIFFYQSLQAHDGQFNVLIERAFEG
jgi:hypothetical protein